jgi:hypothetical protein
MRKPDVDGAATASGLARQAEVRRPLGTERARRDAPSSTPSGYAITGSGLAAIFGLSMIPRQLPPGNGFTLAIP